MRESKDALKFDNTEIRTIVERDPNHASLWSVKFMSSVIIDQYHKNFHDVNDRNTQHFLLIQIPR